MLQWGGNLVCKHNTPAVNEKTLQNVNVNYDGVETQSAPTILPAAKVKNFKCVNECYNGVESWSAGTYMYIIPPKDTPLTVALIFL